jgi:hypothetical protein
MLLSYRLLTLWVLGYPRRCHSALVGLRLICCIRRTGYQRRMSSLASPVLIIDGSLNNSPERSYADKDHDQNGDQELRPCQIETLPDDFYWLAIPIKSAGSINAKPATLAHANRPHAGRPFALIDWIKRDAPQLFLSFSPLPLLLGFWITHRYCLSNVGEMNHQAGSSLTTCGFLKCST